MRVGTSVAVRLVVLLGAFALQAWPGRATAFKAKTHAALANLSLRELDFDSDVTTTVRLHGFLNRPRDLENPDVMRAIRNFPAYFRAGALGPDFFPDMVEAQYWVHPNNGCPVGYGDENALEAAADDAIGPLSVRCTVPSFVPMEERLPTEWRSIDWAMYQLRKAHQWAQGNPADPEWQKAIAFAYGYLAHEAGDSFAHAWINEWSGDTFFLQLGWGTYGTITEEFKHLALENYLDDHLYAGQSALSIAVPEAFLNSLYKSPIEDVDANGRPTGLVWADPDGSRADNAGQFGGQYYEVLLWVRGYLTKLEDHTKWTQLADDVPEWVGLDAVQASIDFQAFLDHIATGGTDLFTPIRDVEEYFKDRRRIVDLLLDKWVRLSACMAQNQLWGAQLPAGVPLRRDACAAVTFEDTDELQRLFRGELDRAAYWHDRSDPKFDYGSVVNNAKKAREFLKQVTSVALRFNVIEDVRSVRETIGWMYDCNIKLVEWESCENACGWAQNEAEEFCTSVVEDYVCSDVMCWLLGLPFVCDEICDLTVKPVTDNVCVDIVNGALPFCNLCSKNSVCNSIEGARDLVYALEDAQLKLLQPVLDKIQERATDWLMEEYFGPDWMEVKQLAEHVQRAYDVSKPAWMVNVAFLPEDLRVSTKYLDDILEAVTGVAGAAASNEPLIQDAVEQTFQSTWSAAVRGAQMYQRYRNGTPSESDLKEYWRAILHVLFRLARDPNRNPYLLDDALEDTAYILDRFDVGPGGNVQVKHVRVVKFLQLLEAFNALSGLRGPTVMAFRAELGLSTDDPYDPALRQEHDGMIEPHDVHALHNTIEAVKLGFLGGSALEKWWAEIGGSPPTTVRSKICDAVPHIFCDAIQSLDDPGNIRYVWWDPTDREISPYCYDNQKPLAEPSIHGAEGFRCVPTSERRYPTPVHVHPPYGFDVQAGRAGGAGSAGADAVLEWWRARGWPSSALGTGTSWPDAELGLARWYSNRYRWVERAETPHQTDSIENATASGASVDACLPTLTDFALASTELRAAEYDKIMRRPPLCTLTWEKNCEQPKTCNGLGMTCGRIQDDQCGGEHSGLRSCGGCWEGQHCTDQGRCQCDDHTKIDCGRGCIDPLTDPNNCNGCFNFCDGDRPPFSNPVCKNGKCDFECWPGWVELDGDRCVNPKVDPIYCGTSGISCPGISNGSAVCNDGRCGLACNSGLTLVTVDGVKRCLALNDPERCGLPGAEVSCAGPLGGNGQAACTAGVCDVACNEGYGRRSVTRTQTYSSYGGPTTTRTWTELSCIPVLSDPANCGATGHACPAPSNATPTCTNGTCGFTCNPGSVLLYNITCKDISSDWRNCGGITDATHSYKCAQPENGRPVCQNGVCGMRCNAGYGLLGNTCTDITSDPNNCGAVGTRCRTMANADATCTNKVCGLQCKPGAFPHYEITTSGYNGSTRLVGCYFTSSDPDHCGSSLVHCPDTTTGHSQRSCTNGTCSLVCDPGYGLKKTTTTVPTYGGDSTTVTTYECKDITSDPDNCGAIGARCPSTNVATRSCTSGQCQFTCKAGYQKCGNACVSLTDVNNCGACGTVCPSPPSSTRTCAGSPPTCNFTCGYAYYRSGTTCKPCPVTYGGMVQCP